MTGECFLTENITCNDRANHDTKYLESQELRKTRGFCTKIVWHEVCYGQFRVYQDTTECIKMQGEIVHVVWHESSLWQLSLPATINRMPKNG